MASISFTSKRQAAEPRTSFPQMPLLWVLARHARHDRHQIRLRHGAVRRLHGARQRPADALLRRRRCRAVAGKTVTTIEGLSADGSIPCSARGSKDVPQCGYCQSGQIMAAAALLAKTAKPTDADIDEAMRGNICRCGTYQDDSPRHPSRRRDRKRREVRHEHVNSQSPRRSCSVGASAAGGLAGRLLSARVRAQAAADRAVEAERVGPHRHGRHRHVHHPQGRRWGRAP